MTRLRPRLPVRRRYHDAVSSFRLSPGFNLSVRFDMQVMESAPAMVVRASFEDEGRVFG